MTRYIYKSLQVKFIYLSWHDAKLSYKFIAAYDTILIFYLSYIETNKKLDGNWIRTSFAFVVNQKDIYNKQMFYLHRILKHNSQMYKVELMYLQLNQVALQIHVETSQLLLGKDMHICNLRCRFYTETK